MIRPPEKLTPEQTAARKQMLQAGFQSDFWRLLKLQWREDCEALYKSMASVEDAKEMFRLQGQLQAFQKCIGEDANFIGK